MNITMDGNGYVHADNTYTGNNIASASATMNTIFVTISQYDTSQIQTLVTSLNTLYTQCTNFNEFLNEWSQVLPKITL